MAPKNEQMDFKSNLIVSIKKLQANLHEGFPDETECLIWLNKICVKLREISEYLHKFLNQQRPLATNVLEMCFLCLRQLICCVTYLEKIVQLEKQEGKQLLLCRTHFLERMKWCLRRIECVSESNIQSETEQNFIHVMDSVINLIEPLTLFSPLADDKEKSIDFENVANEIRTAIEELIGETLAFANVAPEADRPGLMALCHSVMKECIGLQQLCTGSNVTHDDKRMKSQCLQNALFQLEMLANHSILRTFYSVFSDLKRNPVKSLRALSNTDSTETEIDKFDDFLDSILHIGSFAVAHSINVKVKSNLRSSLASCEALSSYLVPSILSLNAELDSKLLEQHWNEEIEFFRRCAQEVIDTNAFCLVLIDILRNFLQKINGDSDLNKEDLKAMLLQCEVFQENLQQNADEFDLYNNPKLKLCCDDFNMMINECKACIRSQNVDPVRIRKRFRILLSVLKNIESALAMKAKNENKSENKILTMNNVTTPLDTDVATIAKPMVGTSMEVMIDLEEFISKRENVAFDTNRNKSILYDTMRKRKNPAREANILTKCSGVLKKDVSSPKRSSRRTSLRVAMFKRQKSLETQQYFDSLTSSCVPADTLNLQLTEILAELSDATKRNSPKMRLQF